jgi:hypothetical protein
MEESSISWQFKTHSTQSNLITAGPAAGRAAARTAVGMGRRPAAITCRGEAAQGDLTRGSFDVVQKNPKRREPVKSYLKQQQGQFCPLRVIIIVDATFWWTF